jgi:hypothetical protein
VRQKAAEEAKYYKRPDTYVPIDWCRFARSTWAQESGTGRGCGACCLQLCQSIIDGGHFLISPSLFAYVLYLSSDSHDIDRRCCVDHQRTPNSNKASSVGR